MALGCCCNCRVVIPPVDLWENITRVLAYPGAADPTPIAPYARPRNVWSGASCLPASAFPASCGEADQPVCHSQNFDGSSIPTNPPAPVDRGVECGEGVEPGDVVSEAANNCYRKTGAQQDFSHNCSPGWKGVAAMAVWPGRFGFIENYECDCDYGTLQSKFTTIAATFNLRNFESATRVVGAANPCGDPVGAGGVYSIESHMDYQQTATVDAVGNVTRTGHRNFYGARINAGYLTGSGAYDPECGGFPIVLLANFSDVYNGCDDCLEASGCTATRCGRPPGTEELGSPPSIFSSQFDTYSWFFLNMTVACGVITFGNEACGIYFSGTAAELETWFETWLAAATHTVSVSLTNSKLEIHVEASADTSGDDNVHAEISIDIMIELSGSSLFSEAMDDCIALLDEWPLHDDAVYPWRSDAKTWLMPYVRRDAAATEPALNWTVDENCDFVQDQLYTGDILGSPLPAGYGRHFDFTHINWTRQNNSGDCGSCDISLGATSPAEIPATATQWLDYNEGSSMATPGASVQQIIDANYSSSSPGPTPIAGVRMVKWAETLERWPSINFFRPFGDDRWRMDMAHASCISAVDAMAGELTLEEDIGTVAAGDLVVIYGGSDYPDQIWRVASYAHPVLTLDTQFDPTPVGTVETLVAASREEWAEAGQWGTYGKVGLLRWQAARAGDGIKWPWQRVCGKPLAITVDLVDPEKVTVPAGNQLISGDKVDALDPDGAVLGGVLYYKRLTDTTGELYTDLALTLPADATGAAKLRGHEDATPPDQEWNTTAARNTVIVREFTSQFREADVDPMLAPFASEETQETLARVNAKQCVFVASPNAQDTDYFSGNGSGSIVRTWDNGRIEADMCFGEEWHINVLQAIADPFWQSPADTCDPAISMESSPCAGGEDTFKHYPLVEPLIDPDGLPDGAPPVPADVTLYTPGAAPTAIGTTFCESEPNERATVHNIRAAWLGCSEWRLMINYGL
jgi:hypothetical protein